MWDLVGNPEDRFSKNKAHFIPVLANMVSVNCYKVISSVGKAQSWNI